MPVAATLHVSGSSALSVGATWKRILGNDYASMNLTTTNLKLHLSQAVNPLPAHPTLMLS